MIFVPLGSYPVSVEGLGVATHVKLVPGTFGNRVTGSVAAPEQISCDKGLFVTVGEGSTVTVKVVEGPEQFNGLGPEGVMVKTTSTGSILML